ncbi:MAG: glutamine synthetase III, partial [Clostridia bacterium]|nr:glutamine synthetase III [Clostridia bacterium]
MEIFGTKVFSDKVMKERLSAETYENLHLTIEEGKPLTIEIANEIASAMKDWALENGATHY